MHGGKRHENRTWSTNYRGPILIHASQGMTKAEYESFTEFYVHDFPRRPLETYPAVPAFDDLPRGGIVGRANLVDCVSASNSPWFFGPYAFVLEDVRAVPFTPFKGGLGLSHVDENVLKVCV
jgi:hypothetical protein